MRVARRFLWPRRVSPLPISTRSTLLVPIAWTPRRSPQAVSISTGDIPLMYYNHVFYILLILALLGDFCRRSSCGCCSSLLLVFLGKAKLICSTRIDTILPHLEEINKEYNIIAKYSKSVQRWHLWESKRSDEVSLPDFAALGKNEP
jgi:hypothetical protein